MAPLQAEVGSWYEVGAGRGMSSCSQVISSRSAGRSASDGSQHGAKAGRADDTASKDLNPSQAKIRNARRARQRQARRCSDTGNSNGSLAQALECEGPPSCLAEKTPSLCEQAFKQQSCSAETSEMSYAASEISTEDFSCGLTHAALSLEETGIEEGEEAKVSTRNRCIARCRQAWHGEQSGFRVHQGCFVNAWIDCKSEHGWIYVEEITDESRQGWVPESILQLALPHERCVQVLECCSLASVKQQMPISAGNILLVDTNSITATGWIYGSNVETTGVGWVPVSCLRMDE